MYIYGNIVKIESYSSQKSPASFKVLNVEDGKTYKTFYLGFLPIQEYDSIKGHVNLDMVFENKPLVVPVESFDYLKKSLYACLRKTNFGHKKCEDFITELTNYSNRNFEEISDRKDFSIINDIFKNLNRWAADDSKRNFMTEVLRQGQMIKFLAWWRKNYLLRRLYLFGLNNREIKFSFIPVDELYDKLNKTPYYVHSITIEKANEINELMGKENKKFDIIGGKVTRFIYQSSWSSTPFSYVVRGFPEIYVCLEYIKENFPLVFEDKFVYSRYCYDMEICLANKVASLLIRTADDQLRNMNLPKVINEIQINNVPVGDSTAISSDKDIILTGEQYDALKGCLENHISVITGGAGCGKTTLIKQIVRNLIYRKEEFVMTSFTGKAVLKIKEILGKELEKHCFTMSLLIQKKKFKGGAPRFDTLIIDESSMISGAHLYEFLQYYKHTFKIILVGDANQLPPIGLCSVFKEIIISGKVPVYYLNENKRILNSMKSSNILLNANRLIEKGRDLTQEFKFFTGKGFEILEGQKEMCYSIINALAKKGVSMDEVTVLTPYNKDIDEINKYAQNIYLKGIDVYQYGKRGFIMGDRMMQTSNVYSEEGEVMNGEEGKIVGINPESLTIRFSKEKIIEYKWNDDKKFNRDYRPDEDVWDNESSEKEFYTCDLKHSFCKTVHKSQGSEYDYVIIYLPPSGGKGSFVNINLLYTAITRTKKTVWLVVDKDTLIRASRTPLGFRCDRLADRIKEIC